MSPELYYNNVEHMASVLYGPIVTQMVLGGILAAAGILILVMGRRRYRRKYGK